MDEITLIDLASDLGYELAMCGAETFRVEESVSRMLGAYGLEAEVFAIPNFLIVTVLTKDGQPITRMRRIGAHGNDLDQVEKLNSLSRAYCAQTPPPEEAPKWLDRVRQLLGMLGNPEKKPSAPSGPASFSAPLPPPSAWHCLPTHWGQWESAKTRMPPPSAR